jgi:hypothetical protein
VKDAGGSGIDWGYGVAVDSSNNVYVTGSFTSGVSTFGGITLTNQGGYDLFIAKYDPLGNVLWAKSCGGAGDDFGLKVVTDNSNNVYVLGSFSSTDANFGGITLSSHGSSDLLLLKYDSAGNSILATNAGGDGSVSGVGILTDGTNGVYVLGSTSASNAFFGSFAFTNQPYASYGSGYVFVAKYDQSGNVTSLTRLTNATASGFALDSKGDMFISGHSSGITSFGGPTLTNAGSFIVKSGTSGQFYWIKTGAGGLLAADSARNIYVAGTLSGTLDGLSITNFGGSDFDLAKLVQLPPSITIQPMNQVVAIGASAALSVLATGAPPMSYQWRFNGGEIIGATNSVFRIPIVQPTNSGSYSVLVSNDVGSTNSQAASLDARYVLVFGDNQLLAGSQASFPLSVSISLQTGFANGSVFYTLDGSEPSFASTYYTGLYELSNSATLRAIAYSADFSQSGESPPLMIKILQYYSVTASSTGGGSVTLTPQSGPYLEGSVITAQATPGLGWTLLQWLGDANGASATLAFPVTGPISLKAVFGTSLATTVAGNGTLQLRPIAALYPYGSVVQLSAVPEAGSYFGIWGNAGSGNANPLYFTVTNPSPTVSSLFAPLSQNQVSLSVIPIGKGRITVTPPANLYSVGTGVLLTATPEFGQNFTGWSGDAVGPQNPLSLVMNQSKVIKANFTQKPVLYLEQGLDGMVEGGFRFSLCGEPGVEYRIDSTTNLLDWQTIIALTNNFGTLEITSPAGTNLSDAFYRAVELP